MQNWFEKTKSFAENEVGNLGGCLNFPASKDEIIAQARNKHLPPEVMKQLEDMPDKKYNNLGEMISAAVREKR